MCYNFTPLRLTWLFECTWSSLEGTLKGNVNLDKERASTALHSKVSCPKFLFVFSLPFCFNLILWWGNGVRGPKVIPLWCLMPKGEKIKAKANGSANHLWTLKIIELEFVFCPKYSYCKIWSLMGENFDYWKRGSFWILIKITRETSLYLPKQVFLT
jgi:hypothetical protein